MTITVMAIARKERKITQIDLANAIGITQAEISMIERGKVTPKDETLDKIAEQLSTPRDELLLDYADWLAAKVRAEEGRTVVK